MTTAHEMLTILTWRTHPGWLNVASMYTMYTYQATPISFHINVPKQSHMFLCQDREDDILVDAKRRRKMNTDV